MGALKDWKIGELQSFAMNAAMEQAKISPEQVQNVVVGNVNPNSDSHGNFCHRDSMRKSGIPRSVFHYFCTNFLTSLQIAKNDLFNVPALQVNRLCGSGFQALANASQDIEQGMSEIAMRGVRKFQFSNSWLLVLLFFDSFLVPEVWKA